MFQAMTLFRMKRIAEVQSNISRVEKSGSQVEGEYTFLFFRISCCRYSSTMGLL